jgi:hypothetical protein
MTGSKDLNASPHAQATFPNIVTIFVLACFYQPLDSIEESFDEKFAYITPQRTYCSCFLLSKWKW